MTDYIKGLDVSIMQGNVNFQEIKNAGVQFVILRGYVGNNGLDADYNKFYQEATDAGLYVATYNFPFPLPGTGSRTPEWQAQTHFAATKTPVHCIDVEWPATAQDWAKYGCSASQINDWLLKYLEVYTGLLGKKPVVYTYPNYAQLIKMTADWAQYPLWIASYQATPFIPHPWTDWVMWQTTGGGGKLPGSGVPVDTDVAKDLSLWGNPSPVAVTPAPPPPAPIVTPVIDVPAPPPPPPVVVAPAPKPPLTHTPASTWITDILDFFINLFSKK